MYIVAIMITAVIFSVTGLGVLNLAATVNLDTQTAVQAVQDRVEVESFANVAMWRLNTGGDSLGTFSSGDLSASYDSVSMVLTIAKTTEELNTGLMLSLEEDSHFKRAVATQTYIDYASTVTNNEPEHQLRNNIGFLPEVDLQYFIDNAANVRWMWNDHIHDGDLVEGINIFYGDNLTIHNVDVENATLVFTGRYIYVQDDVKIKAPIVNGAPQPAIILMNEYSDFHLWQGYQDELRIVGAIYSKGHVRLHEGEFSGPVIAKSARICHAIDMLDDEFPQYYEWNLGFGAYEDYDWPKQIARWEPID